MPPSSGTAPPTSPVPLPREGAAQLVVAVVFADRLARRHAFVAAEILEKGEVVAVKGLVVHFASFFALMRAISSGTIV